MERKEQISKIVKKLEEIKNKVEDPVLNKHLDLDYIEETLAKALWPRNKI